MVPEKSTRSPKKSTRMAVLLTSLLTTGWARLDSTGRKFGPMASRALTWCSPICRERTSRPS